MSLVAFAIPIVPGQRERWDRVVEELNTTHHRDFAESRKHLGLRERTFFQETPAGDMAIVVLEGEDPMRALSWLASDDPFARWMRQELNPVHGVDLGQPMPASMAPEIVLDSGNEANGDDLLAFILPVLPGKGEGFRRFLAEMNGPRKAEFVASRERMGLRQRVFRQSTPAGDISIVTVAGAEPRSIRQWFHSDDPLASYVAREVKETQGVDMTQPLPASATARLAVDSQRPAASKAA